MKGKNDQRQAPPLSAPVVDDKATEGLKKRLRDWGLIVNAGGGTHARPAGKKQGGKR